uniref:BHLH domain-containing protein n=1 Tax=Loxodonta africana TaxID=9785 RepID=G3UAE0_LOXAF
MASWRPEPNVEPHGVTASGGCRSTSPPGALGSCEDRAPGSSSFQGPAPEGQGLCRRRNVLTERERRKRIAASCERLRALLPWFDCRREDMASVLEMAVQFLRLAHTLVPTQGQHVVLPPPQEACHRRWQWRALQVVLGSQAPAGTLDSGTDALRLARPQEPPHGVPLDMDMSVAPSELAEVLGGPSAPPGQRAPCEQGCGFVSLPRGKPGGPMWLSFCTRQPASPTMSPAAQSWPSPAGGTDSAVTSALDARCVPHACGLLPACAPYARLSLPELGCGSVPGPEVEEGMTLLLAASPDWWLGEL